MENLKEIWKQLQDAQEQLALHLDLDKAKSIYQQIEKEERLRRKYAPWLLLYILGIMTLLSWVVYQTSISEGTTFGFVQVLGLALITLGGICITYMTYLVKMPVGKEYFDQQTQTFVENIREGLGKRKKLLTYSLGIFMFCLMAGLHLLIFGFENLSGKGGYLGWFYGGMFSLSGIGISLSLAAFDKHYEEIYLRIDRFLASS